MKRNRLIAGVLVLTAAALVPALGQEKPAEGSPFTYGAEFDFNSRYIWRALAWSQGAAWQPSVWAGVSGFVLNVWTNFPLGDEPNKHQFNEVDLRLSYTKEWGNFTFEPAFDVYSYPNQDKTENRTTGELELGLSYAFSSFALSTIHYFDLIDNSGGYVAEFALEYEEEAAANLTIAAAARLMIANAKFNDYYIPIHKAAIDAAIFELGLTYNITSSVYIRPHGEWTTLLDGEVKDAVAGSPWAFSGKSSLFNLGIAVGIEF